MENDFRLSCKEWCVFDPVHTKERLKAKWHSPEFMNTLPRIYILMLEVRYEIAQSIQARH